MKTGAHRSLRRGTYTAAPAGVLGWGLVLANTGKSGVSPGHPCFPFPAALGPLTATYTDTGRRRGHGPATTRRHGIPSPSRGHRTTLTPPGLARTPDRSTVRPGLVLGPLTPRYPELAGGPQTSRQPPPPLCCQETSRSPGRHRPLQSEKGTANGKGAQSASPRGACGGGEDSLSGPVFVLFFHKNTLVLVINFVFYSKRKNTALSKARLTIPVGSEAPPRAGRGRGRGAHSAGPR